MAAKRDSSLEVEQEVLADRLDAFQPPTVETAGDVQRRGARMGSLDLDPLADESLQAASGAVDAVALGQVSRRPIGHAPVRAPAPGLNPRPPRRCVVSSVVCPPSCRRQFVRGRPRSQRGLAVEVVAGGLLGRAISPVGTREVTAGGTSELPDAT